MTTAAQPKRAPEVIDAEKEEQKEGEKQGPKGTQKGGLLIALIFLALLALFLATNMK